MNLEIFLTPDNVLVDVEASDKARLLAKMCDRIAGKLSLDAEAVLQELLKREALGSTGVGAGAAIPHARIAGLSAPVGAFARLRKPMNFESIDGQPVDLVFLLLAPATASGDHLKILAAVARKLRDPATLTALRGARDEVAVYKAIVAPI